MKHNSVAIDATHGLIFFLYLTMQVKIGDSETNVKLQSVLSDKILTIPLNDNRKDHNFRS